MQWGARELLGYLGVCLMKKNRYVLPIRALCKFSEQRHFGAVNSGFQVAGTN